MSSRKYVRENRFDIGDPVLTPGVIIPTYLKRVKARFVTRALEFVEFEDPQPCKITGYTNKLIGEFSSIYYEKFKCECIQPVCCVRLGLRNKEMFVLEEDLSPLYENFDTPKIFYYKGKSKSMKKIFQT